MNRIAQAGIPVTFAIAGALLLLTAAFIGSASCLAGTALLAALLLAAVADPPSEERSPEARVAGRNAGALAALLMGGVVIVTAFVEGFGLPPQWPVIAVVGSAAAVVLIAPLAALRRAALTTPILRSERSTLLRGSATCAALVAGVLIAAFVLPALDSVVAICFGLITILEGVALARPGGAGIRRTPSAEESDLIAAVMSQAPPDVVGHRRVVVRSTGGAEYLSFDVLLKGRITLAREQAIRALLEQMVRRALPDLVVTVRFSVGGSQDAPRRPRGSPHQP